jgi:hypothetical protein
MKNLSTKDLQIGMRLKPLIYMASLILLIFISIQSHAQVGVGTITPDASAQLDVSSTNKGVLVPRMSKAERDLIQSPATGLLIFQNNETPGFYYYNGTAWITMNSAGETGSAPGFTNGTTGGQVYLTAPTSPYQPQAPQTVTGDVTIDAQGATSITPGTVTLDKLAATGTANQSNYLRGDNTWATPQELISTTTFNGALGTISGNSSAYVFAGPTATVTLTTNKRVTASAVCSLGFPSAVGPADMAMDICYQLVGGGNLTAFSGFAYVLHRVTGDLKDYSATGSILLAAGTYRIGFGVVNQSPNNIVNDGNFYLNGWVMVY